MAALAVVALSVLALSRMLADVDYDDLVVAIQDTPWLNIGLALLFTALSFAALSIYDRQALALVGQQGAVQPCRADQLLRLCGRQHRRLRSPDGRDGPLPLLFAARRVAGGHCAHRRIRHRGVRLRPALRDRARPADGRRKASPRWSACRQSRCVAPPSRSSLLVGAVFIAAAIGPRQVDRFRTHGRSSRSAGAGPATRRDGCRSDRFGACALGPAAAGRSTSRRCCRFIPWRSASAY